MKIDDGGQAFPTSEPKGIFPTGYPRTYEIRTRMIRGMSRRDWLAGKAMEAIILRQGVINDDPEYIANAAYRQADAMIARGRKDENS